MMTISVRNKKKLSFAILGAYNMFDNKFNQYRPEVCPEIGSILKMYNFLELRAVFYRVFVEGD